MTDPIEVLPDITARSVVVRTMVQADRLQVWQALTSDELGAWLGRPDGAPAPMGAQFRLVRDEEITSRHRVSRWRPHRLLGWTWQVADEDVSSVTFRLAPVGADHCVLTVEHRGLGPVLEHAADWSLHLDRLGAHLQGTPRSPATRSEHAALVERLARSAPVSTVAGAPPSRRVGS